jgi:hypothetical protein
MRWVIKTGAVLRIVNIKTMVSNWFIIAPLSKNIIVQVATNDTAK